jgi:hypothetical protein
MDHAKRLASARDHLISTSVAGWQDVTDYLATHIPDRVLMMLVLPKSDDGRQLSAMQPNLPRCIDSRGSGTPKSRRLTTEPSTRQLVRMSKPMIGCMFHHRGGLQHSRIVTGLRTVPILVLVKLGLVRLPDAALRKYRTKVREL